MQVARSTTGEERRRRMVASFNRKKRSSMPLKRKCNAKLVCQWGWVHRHAVVQKWKGNKKIVDAFLKL